MPAHKLKLQKLQCPFCSSTSTRGTGLSAHVRSQHRAHYPKWNRNPNRILEAATAPRPEVIRKAQPIRPPPPVQPDNVTAPDPPVAEQPVILRVPALHVGENSGNEALTLLQRAYEQLSTRKQTIESEWLRWKQCGMNTKRSPHRSPPLVGRCRLSSAAAEAI
jgi:hypothetical protein